MFDVIKAKGLNYLMIACISLIVFLKLTPDSLYASEGWLVWLSVNVWILIFFVVLILGLRYIRNWKIGAFIVIGGLIASRLLAGLWA